MAATAVRLFRGTQPWCGMERPAAHTTRHPRTAADPVDAPRKHRALPPAAR